MATTQLNPWATTGAWNGQYGPNGLTYYYGGRQYQTPQDIYAAMGQPYEANVLPYGTGVYSASGLGGGQSEDASINTNPVGSLGSPTGPTTSSGATQGYQTPTTPAPPNNTAGATGGTGSGLYPPGSGGTTAADVFNPLENPTDAVYRALRSSGYNPDFPTWGMNQLLRRAQ